MGAAHGAQTTASTQSTRLCNSYCHSVPATRAASLPLRQLTHLPPPTAPERERPPPEGPCLWSQSLAVACAPAALPLGQGTTHPPAGGRLPSALCSQAARPSSVFAALLPVSAPVQGRSLPRTTRSPHRLCSSALDTVRAGRPEQVRAQGFAELADKVSAITQNAAFPATKLTEEEVGI